jgi:formylglycine-generating enzyme required for sulfatase activity
MDAEVTFEFWDACVKYSGCNYSPSDDFVGRGSFPVVNVSYDDITTQFIPWLNEILSASFRLPSEAEWEYAAKGNSYSSKYSWGNTIDCTHARYQVLPEGNSCNQPIFGAVEIKSFAANNYGLFDMHGNVDEWTEDCLNYNYKAIPNNGKPFITPDCSSRMIRGGSWVNQSENLRLSSRDWHMANERIFRTGFRLVSSHK